MIKVGIAGIGVIGGALMQACMVKKGIFVTPHDKFKGMNNLQGLLGNDIVFLCLPTPTVEKEQDLTALDEVLSFLSKANFKGSVLIRSTVTPGTTQTLNTTYTNLALGHCPEFLTAATPFEDLIKQPAVLVGSEHKSVQQAAMSFWSTFDKKVPIVIFNTPTESEVAKYVHNILLATKVAVLNEIYDVCQVIGTNYDSAVAGARAIGQIGNTHLKVPGPDGKTGFGGMCFVKDTAAFSGFAQSLGLQPTVLGAVIGANKKRRPEAYDGREATGYNSQKATQNGAFCESQQIQL